MTGYTLDRPVALGCPECGGTLRSELVGTLLQYRCHIGHVLSAETMLVATLQRIDDTLGSCLAQLNERAELCRQILADGTGDEPYRAAVEGAAAQAEQQAEVIRNMLQSEWVQPVHIAQESTA